MFRFEGLVTACRGGDAALDGDESTIDQLEKNANKVISWHITLILETLKQLLVLIMCLVPSSVDIRVHRHW